MASKKNSPEKPPLKKAVSKKAVPKKAASKKKAPKKVATKKSALKKGMSKKVALKKAASKKPAKTKSVSKKARFKAIPKETISLTPPEEFPTSGDCVCMQKKPDGKFFCFRFELGKWIQSFPPVPFSTKEICEAVCC